MGLFDSIAKQALGGLLGGKGGAGGLDLGALLGGGAGAAGAADGLSGMLNQVGGLEGLQEKFGSAGLGEVFNSWVGSGENQPVAPAQLENALGGDAIQSLSSNLGIQSSQLLPLLSQFLPMIIDQLTPKGAIDQNQPSGSELQSVLANVVKSGLGGLFGGSA
ncbi:MAG: DUF937 domain-containing protein [Verrucomicrobiales bacterium]|nr:DUF937 domain-containing protein [Verrucomicrobiales bacterium]